MKFNIFKTFFLIIIFFNINFSFAEILKPNISILPSEVVKLQLSSLQNNNSPNIDSGILQTWEFAHPKNKSFTGPYDKFKNMIKKDTYSILINHKSHEVKEGDEVNVNLLYFDHDKKRLQYKLEMIHKEKKFLASTIEILSLYVDLDQRKVSEFESEKIIIMKEFIKSNSQKFKNDNLIFSNKLKK